MIAAILRRPILAAMLALLVLVTILSSVSIVPETRQALIVRFGKPDRIYNRYRPSQPIGGTGAGLAFRVPFLENVVWIDKRVRDVDMERQQVLSTDQLRLEVDAFARYRIVDPLRMYISARSEDRVGEALRPILGSELRNELGKRPFADLLSPERQGAMENIRRGLDRVARQYGVQIIDVRIKRADLPDGSPLQSAYDRMKTAREQEARSIRAEGAKQAQIIRAEADAEAAKTYATSFGKDPAFYDFYRAMQAYQRTFVDGGKDRPTNVILSPQNEFLREFTRGGGR
ncbi:protease modulator HflC [Sphingomonas astaxanthinifaciens]|uniref:Protein HflC n=1 Tax=Sphingomonas astaxanthinifaciens DSM 22298 TaxID=1123267 RepID=A0ABQ5Z8J1_9SPHN|nr:protease modulator HflC [Sphingomonas astaxanthinifaciens]GLR47178.1 protein HflC [Sphingomonas astaxanthinifaciens DSM 22298]